MVFSSVVPDFKVATQALTSNACSLASTLYEYFKFLKELNKVKKNYSAYLGRLYFDSFEL